MLHLEFNLVHVKIKIIIKLIIHLQSHDNTCSTIHEG